MNTAISLAQHLRHVFFGGNWTTVCLKEHLTNLSWQQATTPVLTLNTIAALTYHIHYYVAAQLRVLQGQPLQASDRFSFDHPPIQSQKDWENLLVKVWSDVETMAQPVEQLPDSMLEEAFADETYGRYYRNIQGMIEHTHYHLGQIVLTKKLQAAPLPEP